MKTSADNPVDRIIRKFGSQTKLAEALGISQASISEWRSKGYVPGVRHQEIFDFARANGIPIAPEDFLIIEPTEEGAGAAIAHSG